MPKQQQTLKQLNTLIVKKTADLELLTTASGYYPIAHAELQGLKKRRDKMLDKERNKRHAKS